MFRIRGLTPSIIARMLMHRPDLVMSTAQHVFICIADHFEPLWQKTPRTVQEERIERWQKSYPVMVAGLKDTRGRSPQHTFFYPAEQYDSFLVEKLAELCRAGHGDVEVHLHHENDTSNNFRETLESFTEALYHRHGLLRRGADGKISYGFIHGDWALDNSHPEGRWCGVNDEISLLCDTGCYADFTLPSAPSPCQTWMINSIYYATDDPSSPKSHDRGVLAECGSDPPLESLLMIQGPLVFDWQHRKWAILPSIENGNLQGVRAASFERFQLWHKASVIVKGRPDWRFIKIHTHGCDEANTEILLGESMRRFHQALLQHSKSHPGFKYYYVTAHEMAMLVHQAEQGVVEPIFPFAESQCLQQKVNEI